MPRRTWKKSVAVPFCSHWQTVMGKPPKAFSMFCSCQDTSFSLIPKLQKLPLHDCKQMMVELAIRLIQVNSNRGSLQQLLSVDIKQRPTCSMKLSAGKDKLKLIFRGKLPWPSSLHPRVSVTSVIYYRAGVGFSPIHWAWVFKFQHAPLTTSAQSLVSFDHLGEQCSTQGGTVCISQHAPRNVIKNIQTRSLFENDTFKIWAFHTPRTDPADLPYPCQSLQPFLEKEVADSQIF